MNAADAQRLLDLMRSSTIAWLDVESPGMRLRAGRQPAPPPAAPVPADETTDVTSPAVGTVSVRVEAGERVAAGQELASVRTGDVVRRTTAEHSATVGSVETHDGDFVEFGQVLVRLTRSANDD